MRRIVEEIEGAVDVDVVERAFFDANLVDQLGIGNDKLHVARDKPVSLRRAPLALAGALDEGLPPIGTDDATGRTNMIGELVDTLAAATRQIERHLIVQAAGNEHLATTVETA